MNKHLLCAAFNIKLTTGSGNAGTCEKLHDRSRIRLRQKAGVCASALTSACVDNASYRVGVARRWANAKLKATEALD